MKKMQRSQRKMTNSTVNDTELQVLSVSEKTFHTEEI